MNSKTIILFCHLFLVLSCSEFEQDSTVLREEDFQSVKSNDISFEAIFFTYNIKTNSLFILQNDSLIIREYTLFEDELNYDKQYKISHILDQSQALQYSLLDTLLIVYYPDSVLAINFYKDSLEAKIEHFGNVNTMKNFPYGLNIGFKPCFIDNKLYLENFNYACQNYPLDCSSYSVLWEYDVRLDAQKEVPINYQKDFYLNFLKYQSDVSSVWTNDTMFTISSSQNIIEAFDLGNSNKYSNTFLGELNELDFPSSEKLYYDYLMDIVSFGNQYTNLQFNKKNNKLYLMYIAEIPKYDDEGLLNYSWQREKYILEFDKSLIMTNKLRIPDSFSSKFFVFNDGLLFFKTNESQISSIYLFPL